MNLEYVNCNLCGRDDSSLVFVQRDQLTECDQPFNVVRCRQCGLVYVNPRPASAEMGAFYPTTFFSYQLDLKPEAVRSARARMIAFVARSSAEQRVDALRRWLNPNQNYRVLDMGCGKGGFLSVLRERLGCSVAGVDFDGEAARYCRENLHLDVVTGDARALETLKGGFDLVTMWHYLEHEFNPAATLRSVNKLLDTDSYVLIEVPNASSLENRLCGRKSFLYDIPRHLYHFSPDTLSRLLRRSGFEVEKIHYPYFSGGWIGTLQGILTGGKVFKELRNNIYLFLFLSLLALPIDLAATLVGRGSILRVLARKVGEPEGDDLPPSAGESAF